MISIRGEKLETDRCTCRSVQWWYHTILERQSEKTALSTWAPPSDTWVWSRCHLPPWSTVNTAVRVHKTDCKRENELGLQHTQEQCDWQIWRWSSLCIKIFYSVIEEAFLLNRGEERLQVAPSFFKLSLLEQMSTVPLIR